MPEHRQAQPPFSPGPGARRSHTRSSFDATSQHHEEKAFALVFDSAEPDDTEIQSFRVGPMFARCHAQVPCSLGSVGPMLAWQGGFHIHMTVWVLTCQRTSSAQRLRNKVAGELQELAANRMPRGSHRY